MITVDLHLHTCHSHGKASPMEMFQAARANGLEIIGFSEHSPRPVGYDYPTDYRDSLTASYPEYVNQVRAIQAGAEKVNGPQVLLGLEMDWFEGQQAFIADTISRYEYDYIIAGIHFLDTWGFDFTPDDWNSLNDDARAQLYTRYYRTMKSMAETGLFNIVAHPDLIKIFSAASFARWLSAPENQAPVREALHAVKNAGMAMEISSAGLRKPCAEIYPAPPIMRMAREMDIPVSFASDAHCTNTPAHAFDELARYAASFGYTESVWYAKRVEQRRPF